MSGYLAFEAYVHFEQNRVVTNLYRTTMPVTELDFPSVTVCRQGIDMAAVMKALELDFELWQNEGEPGPQPETRVKREVRDLDTFMRERYGQIDMDHM